MEQRTSADGHAVHGREDVKRMPDRIDIDEAHPPEVELVIFDRSEHGQVDDDERRERRRERRQERRE